MTYNFTEEYDIIVIGAGHAGVEASLAASRMGCKVLLATINIEMLAFMPCNPSIGGSAKGIVVREVDALGGEMAKTIDKELHPDEDAQHWEGTGCSCPSCAG